jgi:hypothetical protein
MSGSIRLHKTAGLNPKMGLCPLCKEENGEILLPGAAMPEEGRYAYGNPCDKCKALLAEGNVGFYNKETNDSALIKGEAVKRMFPDKYDTWKGKIVFTTHTFWDTTKEVSHADTGKEKT